MILSLVDNIPDDSIVESLLQGERPTWQCAEGTFRFTFYEEPDEFYDIRDDDWYGKIERAESHPYRFGCNAQRPEGFDGRARLLKTRYDAVWWQPADDMDDVMIDSAREFLMNILEYGYFVHSVEVERKCDCCDKWSTVGSSCRGGNEPFRGVGSYDMSELLWEALDYTEVES